MMTGLEAACELLPTSVVWGPVLVWGPAAFVVSLLSAELGARIALRPLRQARDRTWAVRARLAYPARLVARTNALFLPAVHGGVALAVPQAFCGLSAGLIALLLVLASYAGAAIVSFRVERYIRQGQYTFGQYLRAVSVLWLLFRGPALVLLALLLLMPATFNARAWLLLTGGAAAILPFAVGGGIYIVWLLGLVKPASARLRGIVSRTAGSMGVPVRGVHELAFPVANAAPAAICKPRRALDTIRLQATIEPVSNRGGRCRERANPLGTCPRGPDRAAKRNRVTVRPEKARFICRTMVLATLHCR